MHRSRWIGCRVVIAVSALVIDCFRRGSILHRVRRLLSSPLLFLLLAPAVWSMTAEEIITKMEKRYSHFHSYRDTGYFTGRSKEAPTRFKTYFVRPDHFRFEWTWPYTLTDINSDNSLTEHRVLFHDMIWSNSEGAFQRYEGTTINAGEIQKEDSLDLAVSGAHGASLGAASTVVDLLLDRTLYYGFPKLKKLRLLPETRFAGILCYRIKGLGWKARTPCEVLIGKNDLLLRRFRVWYENNPNDPVEQVRSDIRINGHIPETVFHFETR
jgi:hypothetical protein